MNRNMENSIQLAVHYIQRNCIDPACEQYKQV